LRKIAYLRMVIIDTVISTVLGRLTLDRAGMHRPSSDDAFVPSFIMLFDFLLPLMLVNKDYQYKLL